MKELILFLMGLTVVIAFCLHINEHWTAKGKLSAAAALTKAKGIH